MINKRRREGVKAFRNCEVKDIEIGRRKQYEDKDGGTRWADFDEHSKNKLAIGEAYAPELHCPQTESKTGIKVSLFDTGGSISEGIDKLAKLAATTVCAECPYKGMSKEQVYNKRATELEALSTYVQARKLANKELGGLSPAERAIVENEFGLENDD